MFRSKLAWRLSAPATILVAASLGAAPGAASAATCDWQGADGADWRAATGNWSCGHIPDSADDVVLGSSDIVTVGTQDEAAGSLSMSGIPTGGDPTGITIGSGRKLTVSGQTSVAGGDLEGPGTLVADGAFAKTTSADLWVRFDAKVVLNAASTIEGGPVYLGVSPTGCGYMDVNATLTLGPTAATGLLGSGTCLLSIKSPNGKLVKDSPGESAVSQNIDNATSVEVKQGDLNLSSVGSVPTQAGTWSVASGSRLIFSGGAHNLNGSTSGAGQVRVTGGVVTVGATAGFSPGSLRLSGGTLETTGAAGPVATIPELVVDGGDATGARPWSVGTLDAQVGRLGSGTMTVTGSFTKTTSGVFSVWTDGTLVLAGASSISEGHVCVGVFGHGGGLLRLQDTLTLDSGADASPVQPCSNVAGNFQIEGPDGLLELTGAISKTIANVTTNAGTIAVGAGQTLSFDQSLTQSAGQTTIAAGGTLAASPTLTGGTIGGSGEIDGSLVNTSGHVAPGDSPGTLTVTGDFTQGADGTLDVDVEGTGQGTTYDWLKVTGAATLDGTVNVIRPNAFTPAAGDSFQFLTSGSRSGTFDSPPVFDVLDGDHAFTLDYPAGPDFGARLLVTGTASPANQQAPQVSGTAAAGQTVNCDPGTWSGSPTFAFQWLLDGQEISGATDQTFGIGSAEAGHQLACRVTATNDGGSVQATSPAVTVAGASTGGSTGGTGGPNGETYTIAAVAGTGGSVRASMGTTQCPNNTCVAGRDVEVSLTATPDAGFQFGGWSGTGCSRSASYALTLKNVNATCSAQFIPQYTISGLADPPEGGTVTAFGAGSCVGSTCTVAPGALVQLTATPADGYRFAGWSGPCAASTNPMVAVSASADITCTAHFTAISRVTLVDTRAKFRRGRVRIRLACSAGATPCIGNVRLLAKKKNRMALRLGRASFSIAAGRTRTVSVKLSKRGKALLERRHTLRARVKISSQGGQTSAAALTILGEG